MTHPDAPTLSKASAVSLREVTRDNLREVLSLKVAPDQEKFVANNAVSIAQAHFYPETAWFRAIYADETPVGFMMLSDDASKPEYFLWRLMLDARYQKFGFAARAMHLLFDYVRTRPNAREILPAASRVRAARTASTKNWVLPTPATWTMAKSSCVATCKE